MFRQHVPKNERWEDIHRREFIQNVTFFIFIIPVGYLGVVCAMSF